MRLLHYAEVEGVKLKRTGPKTNRAVYEAIRGLEIGQGLIVEFGEWKSKSSLQHTLHNSLAYRGRFTVRLLDNDEGVLVKRLK